MVAGAALLIEYLLVSMLFDARELVPEALKSIGDLAPIPIVIGVAFLILKSSAQDADQAPLSSDVARTTSPRRAGALLLLHLATFGAFLAVSFFARDQRAAGAQELALDVGWAALAAAVALSLAAFALSGGLLDVLRRLAGPLALGAAVGLLAWAAGQGTEELWRPLSRATLAPVAALVGAFSADLVVDVGELVVGTERFSIRVDPVCSGYEGMGLLAVLLGAYVWSFRSSLRFPHALLLPVVGVALAFVANVARITALLYVGSLGAPEVAMGGFHSKAGWLLFCGVALGIVAIARRTPALQRTPLDEDERGRDNPAATFLMPLLALVAASLLAGLASDGGLDRFEAIAVGAALLALWPQRQALRVALTGEGALVARPTLVAVAAGLAVFALWIALEPDDGGASQRIEDELSALTPFATALWVATRLFASVLVVPLAEELAFRGFLLRRLVRADFSAVAYRAVTPLAVVASSLVFGALHERFLAGVLAGLAYAVVPSVTGRLRDAVLAHAVTNALIATMVLGAGRWSLWD